MTNHSGIIIIMGQNGDVKVYSNGCTDGTVTIAKGDKFFNQKIQVQPEIFGDSVSYSDVEELQNTIDHFALKDDVFNRHCLADDADEHQPGLNALAIGKYLGENPNGKPFKTCTVWDHERVEYVAVADETGLLATYRIENGLVNEPSPPLQILMYYKN